MKYYITFNSYDKDNKTLWYGSGYVQAEALTEETIDSFYDDIYKETGKKDVCILNIIKLDEK